ncbi:hypothetical protein [Streptomyces sp. NBC_00829]|uniref:hypothetical protein n=1 Tax=Streptomyces sp. NBC_00829 TaxID=2903679 RepID=UPI003863C3B4|nr:hypothetical protein OG293_25220 [Streptomyces sp. NBC_00829]
MSRTRGMDRRAVRRLSVGLSVTALLGAGACSPGEQSGSPSKSPTVTGSASTTTPDTAGAAAKSVLERAFVTRESLGAGSGGLEGGPFGNTHPSAPDDVLSVTFAFTCTGGAKVALKIAVGDKDVPSAAGTQVCDGSIFQRSIDMSKPGPLGFSAAVTGSQGGGYAYAYYAEKKQLP